MSMDGRYLLLFFIFVFVGEYDVQLRSQTIFVCGRWSLKRQKGEKGWEMEKEPFLISLEHIHLSFLHLILGI